MPKPAADDCPPPDDRPQPATPPRGAVGRRDATPPALPDVVAEPPPVRWRLPTDPPPA